MKTLQDVAKAYKKAAGKAIYPGVPYSGYKTGTSKAFKTGNLLTKFVSSPLNQAATIGRKTMAGYELVLDVSPNGAEYGSYVHFGTRKMKARPFAELATNDPEFISTLNEFILDEVGDIVGDYMGVMDSKWSKAGFTVS